MLQSHSLDISAASGGKLKVVVHLKDRVPDWLSDFPMAVQRRVQGFRWWPTPYEYKLMRACIGMPWWARATVRQHILHQRAIKLSARLERLKAKREKREQQQKVRLEARARILDERKAKLEQRAKAYLDAKPAARLSHRDLPKTVAPKKIVAQRITRPIAERPSEPPKDKLTLTQMARYDAGTALGPALPRKLTLTGYGLTENPMHPGVEPKMINWNRGR